MARSALHRHFMIAIVEYGSAMDVTRLPIDDPEGAASGKSCDGGWPQRRPGWSTARIDQLMLWFEAPSENAGSLSLTRQCAHVLRAWYPGAGLMAAAQVRLGRDRRIMRGNVRAVTSRHHRGLAPSRYRSSP
jgi:hypothetical protein